MATTDSIRSDDCTQIICDGIINTTIAFLPENTHVAFVIVFSFKYCRGMVEVKAVFKNKIQIQKLEKGPGGVCQNTNTDVGVGAGGRGCYRVSDTDGLH